jgi:MazG family protein
MIRSRGDVAPLLDLIVRLRAPGGCPWDREQTAADIRAFLIEEAHETAAAIDAGDWGALVGELGDLLFQVCFLAVLAEEAGRFDLADAVTAVHDKMVERHPHVFGTPDETAGATGLDADRVAQLWEQRKLERATSSPGERASHGAESLLAGVPASLPALVGAFRMTQKAAGIGFDWSHPAEVLDKLEEELDELRDVLRSRTGEAADGARIEEELGDLLFAAANLARHLRVDPERALARANLKFRRRFAHVERGVAGALASGTPAADLRERMEALWREAKRAETGDGRPPG